MDITKQDISTLLAQGKKIPTKILIHYYKAYIFDGMPYDVIINKIKTDFDISISYGAFGMGVKRHLDKSTEKLLAQQKLSNLINKPPSETKELKKLEIKQNQDSTQHFSEPLKPTAGIVVEGF